MKVLVIEDDPSLREIICRSLEKERYVTEEAPDFQTALEKTADYTYDCILLDIMLPDGNGLDLLEELKKENKKENIIVNVENVKTRSGWNGVKPYTRIHTPKVVYTRKGRRNGKEALV